MLYNGKNGIIPDNKTYPTLLAVILGSPVNKLKAKINVGFSSYFFYVANIFIFIFIFAVCFFQPIAKS